MSSSPAWDPNQRYKDTKIRDNKNMIYREPILNNSSNSKPDPYAEIRFQPITLCKFFLILNRQALLYYILTLACDKNISSSLAVREITSC